MDIKELRRQMRKREVKMPDLAEYIGESVGTLYRHIRQDNLTVKEVRAIQALLQFEHPEDVLL